MYKNESAFFQDLELKWWQLSFKFKTIGVELYLTNYIIMRNIVLPSSLNLKVDCVGISLTLIDSWHKTMTRVSIVSKENCNNNHWRIQGAPPAPAPKCPDSFVLTY